MRPTRSPIRGVRPSKKAGANLYATIRLRVFDSALGVRLVVVGYRDDVLTAAEINNRLRLARMPSRVRFVVAGDTDRWAGAPDQESSDYRQRASNSAHGYMILAWLPNEQ